MRKILVGFYILSMAAVFFQPAYAEDFLAQPSMTDTAAPHDYVLQPEDVVQVNVYEEPELTATVRISAQGEINYPLLGTINVSGFTVSKLQSEITRLLEADYLVNPQVTVFIQSYHARSVSVTGAVNKPGSYHLPVGKTMRTMEMIAMAGGFTKVAATGKVRIIRSTDGRSETLEVNAKDIVTKGDKGKDLELKPNDVIFVPESWL